MVSVESIAEGETCKLDHERTNKYKQTQKMFFEVITKNDLSTMMEATLIVKARAG